MKTVRSSRCLLSVVLFLIIYVVCLAIVFYFDSVWDSLDILSHKIDSLLDNAGIAFADGEADPAGLWVIFGAPLMAALLIYILLKKRFI